jgi:hypothetical protein
MAESLKLPRYRCNTILGTKCLDMNLLDSGDTIPCTYVITSDGQGGRVKKTYCPYKMQNVVQM